uniref:DUF1501 domain-containing protein n=1 Tax=Vitiosangium cumulatum TaxID=1867796 RepID=A0A7D5BVA1_9BACT|nr:hypothetical protein [Vitiosangium cumulatum]
MTNTSRRTLLKWALGAGQFALLERAGLLGSSAARAADIDVPSRLAVLYIPGGFRPAYYFTPMDDADIPLCVPAPSSYNGEPIYFDASKVVNLAPPNGPYKPLRTWQSWNPLNPAERSGTFSPLMYGYSHFSLHEQLSVLHGIDQGTNDHSSAFIASMCGVAGADFRAPAVHSVIANHLFEKYRESRPLPFVVVTGERGTPLGMGLPSHASPVRVPSIEALKPQLSAKPADNPWWTGLDARTEGPELNASGQPTGGTLKTTTVERFSLSRTPRMMGRSTAKVDSYLEGLHGSLSSVSRVLATDVVSVLESTKGIDVLKAKRPEYLSSYLSESFTYTFGLANFHLTGLDPRMDLALRLLKSDLCTSVHVSLKLDFDTHNAFGHGYSCAHGRGLMDCVARFLGELKAAPAPGKPGKTLLDDTLVLVMSEFGRSWASRRSDGTYALPDDHHPYTSVCFAGGNVAANRQVGSYTPRGLGVPVDILEENGQPSKRVPRAADAVTTALRILGMGTSDFFIPGGYGEVMGIRKA